MPKDEDGKVANFGDIRTVELEHGVARSEERVNLQPIALERVEKIR